MDGLTVPLIDISEFASGNPSTKRGIAEQVARAVEEIGFFTITGHGIANDVLSDTAAALAAFFDLPQTAKLESINPTRNNNRGYVPFGQDFAAASQGVKTPPDRREAMAFGRFDVSDDPYYRHPDAGYAYETNIWPSGLDKFAPTIRHYYRSLEKLNTLLLRIFATGLDLEETFLLDKFDKHASVLRAINYPVPDGPPLPGQLRCGEHSDFGSHTLLQIQDAPGGLQVLNRADRWVDVEPPPGSFVVNIGDLMMNWTNDRWFSNKHRVVNPPADSTETRRQTIAFFVQPNYDALIECIPTCRASGEEPKHPPVKAWEYRHARLSRTTVGHNQPQG